MQKSLLLSLLLCSSKIFAQTPEDALRYSYYPQNGTARNLAVGGAMGSLGGDINATFANPAGLGFYKTAEAVFSPSFYLNNNSASFRGTNIQNNRNSFGFGPTGIVYGFGSRYRPEISNAFSIAMTQTINFNNRVQYKGLNNYSSFSEQFAEEFAKSGYTINQVLDTKSPLPYTSAPALYTYLIDTVNVGGVYKVKGAPEYVLDAGQAIYQQTDQDTKGAMTELAIGFAHNNHDKWYWGFTLSMPFVYYKNKTTFQESDTSDNVNNHFKHFEYTDDFTTSGLGFTGRLGVIYRPKDYVRIGLSVQTPTYMELTDKRTTTLSTELENPVANFNVGSKLFTNNEPGESHYHQTTAFRATLSGSYVFREVSNVKRQRAFLTADIEYVHHKGSRFGSENGDKTDYEKAYYKGLNNVVSTNYKGTFNFRVGGELKFNVIMGRLGFAYYGNPYKDAELKASRMLLSGGLGYRDKGYFIDLTYVHAINKDVNFPYRLQDRANTYATTKQVRGNIVATVGVKF
ncbi:MAG TPA: hypothetical protein VKH37_12865 [Ferruginibacter sp.]|nr:hypothetical protein [Ferruginibacter sp.]